MSCPSEGKDKKPDTPCLSPLGRGRHLAQARWRVRGLVAEIQPLTRFARFARKPPSPQRGEGLKGGWFGVSTTADPFGTANFLARVK